MKPPPFDYAAPSDLDELLGLLAEHRDEATIIAGGQSLIPLLNLRLARPELVVDPRRIHELTAVDARDGSLVVGAMVRAADLEVDPLASRVPGLLDCLAEVGHSQIRARTTIGGSIAHADPAAELPALLVALDGSVTLASQARGARRVGAADFFLGPLTTAREDDECLTHVHLPAYGGFLEVAEVAKRPGDFAVVGAIAGFDTDEAVVTDARIVVFGVAGTPVRLSGAESLLVDRAPTAESFADAGDWVREHLETEDDLHAPASYRRDVAATLVERCLARGAAT